MGRTKQSMPSSLQVVCLCLWFNSVHGLSWTTVNSAVPPRAFASAVTYQTYAYVIVGYDSAKFRPVNDVNRYNIVTHEHTMMSKLPAARYGHSCCVSLSGDIYCIGGFRDDSRVGLEDGVSPVGDSMAMMYSIAENLWYSLKEDDMHWLLNPTLSFQVGAGQTAEGIDLGSVFVFGGQKANSGINATTGKQNRGLVASSILYRWDITLRFFSQSTPCPVALGSAASVQSNGVEGYFWVMGGIDTSGAPTDALYRYRKKTNTWTKMSSMPIARTSHTAVVVSDDATITSPAQIYVIGGVDAAGNALNSVLRYNVSSDVWTTVTALPYGVHSHASVITPSGHIWVIGGSKQSGFNSQWLNGTIV